MFGYLVIAATIAFFYKAGDMADDEKIGGHKREQWAFLSAALWSVSIFVLGWGGLMGLLPQVALFVGLTAYEAREGHRAQEKMKANVREALERRDRELRQGTRR
jgi:hypothetical protein